LELTKGKETINTAPLFPMWILLKMEVTADVARYFKISMGEYKIEPSTLTIENQLATLKLETNGYAFASQENSFPRY
jgi:hypothetical protein